MRIPETWDERGYDYPKDVPIEELIFVPENAQYYAAFGAVLYGLHEPADVGALPRPRRRSSEFIINGRKARARRDAPGPPLVADDATSSTSSASCTRSRSSTPAKLEPGQVVRARHRPRRRLDLVEGGAHRRGRRASSSKAYQLSKGNPIQDTKELLARAAATFVHRPGRDARGASASAPPATPPTCSRSRVQRRRQHRRDRRAHDERRALLRRRRRHLRHRRAGHQGPVHEERRHRRTSACRTSARPATACCCRRWPTSSACQVTDYADAAFEARARAEVQLRLRRVPRLRPRELPEGGLLEGGAARRPRAGAAEERLAVRRADPAHGRARHARSCSRAARSTTWPRVKAQVDYIKERVPGRRGLRPPAHAARPARSAPRSRPCASSSASGTSTFIGLDAGDRPRVHVDQRRDDALPLLPEQLLAHVHRHRDARRRDQPLHLRLLLREGHGRDRRRRCWRSSRSARS